MDYYIQMIRLTPKILEDLAPGMISLIVYVIVSAIWSMDLGIYAAMGSGVAGLYITYLKDYRFVKLIMIDTFLLFVSGIAALMSGNEIYFKIKPVLLEGILLVILWHSPHRKKNYILELSGRYITGMRIVKTAALKRNRFLFLLIGFLGVHIISVLYASFYFPTVVWGIISILIFYVVIAAFVAYYYLSKKCEDKKFSGLEIIPVVDESGTVTGKEIRDELHFNPEKKFLHPVVHLHVFNREGLLYLQKRQSSKKVQPGKWDTAVGGHIDWGETLEEGLIREAREEIGLEGFKPFFRKKYIWETDVEKELVYMFSVVINHIPEPDPGEISEGRFWRMEEIRKLRGSGIFTPNLEYEMVMLGM